MGQAFKTYCKLSSNIYFWFWNVKHAGKIIWSFNINVLNTFTGDTESATELKFSWNSVQPDAVYIVHETFCSLK